ncbi:MAG: hypothetical protein MJ103_02950 [Saccharofermentans sp.]|nr:hypothetical protein [Saccharofermentans sp.]
MNKNDYFILRNRFLDYTYKDINLVLQNDKQVYSILFDIPQKSIIKDNDTISIALMFGLNTHIYAKTGQVITGLEKNPGVMKAMQSIFISIPQALDGFERIANHEYTDSEYIRVYLRTMSGLKYRELRNNDQIDRFITMMLNVLRTEINKCI